MKTPSFPLLAVLWLAAMAGCTGVHKTGTSRVDEFDAVKVDQMTGNQIAPRVLARSILCLNARRETRWVGYVTNVAVYASTNLSITPVTNLTVSISTNYQYTLMTNLAPLPPAPPVTVAPSDATAVPAAPAVPGVAPAPPSVEATNVVVTNVPAQFSTNLTISVANNNSGTLAPNQATANQQTVRNYNNNLTTVSNNLTVSLVTNRMVTAETNVVVVWATNSSVTSLTNVSITPTNYPDYDYYLVSEMIAPPDFTPVNSGESLVLLVDGVRHGFASSQPGTAYVSRRGYASTLYRVPPDVLVDIANAKEVRVRFKGINSTLERIMSSGCKDHFKQFLLKFFTPDPPAGAGPSAERKMASVHP